MLRRRTMEQLGPAIGRGVVVLGTHRSGTSAVAGAINALGLPVCRAEDRMYAWRWNERGFYESRSLTQFDEELLRDLGGAWWAPPRLRPGWATRGEFRLLRTRAARVFAAAHPEGRWIWKDPRACVLMQFWDIVLGDDIPRMVVLRHPLETAASLVARNRMPLGLGLALGERNLRASLADSARRPVLITSFDEVLEDGEGWCRRVAAFLGANGISLPEPLQLDAARAHLDETLRHQRQSTYPDADGGMSPAHTRLWRWALERRGVHAALSVKGLPRESPETDGQLRAWLISYVPPAVDLVSVPPP